MICENISCENEAMVFDPMGNMICEDCMEIDMEESNLEAEDYEKI